MTKEEHGLSYYLDLINRRFGFFLVLFTSSALLVFIASQTVRPLYQSSATILVNRTTSTTGAEFIFNPSAGSFSARPNLANHIEIIKSRTLAQLVLDTLSEAQRTELQRYVTNDPVVELVNSLTVRAVRDADILKLSVNAPTRELARALALAYVDAYQAWTLERNRADIRAVREFVATQLAGISTRLDSAEQALEKYKRTVGSTDLSAQAQALIERQSTVLSLYERTNAELAGLKKELALLPNLDSTAADNRAPGTNLPLLASITAQLTTLETERTGLIIQGYDTLSPRLQELSKRVDELKTRLTALFLNEDPTSIKSLPEVAARRASIATEITRLEAQRNVLKATIAHYDQELNRLPTEERQLARLTRDVEVARQVHSLLELKLEEARIQEAGRLSPVALIDAPGPGRKIRPSPLKNALTALLFSILFALGTTTLVDRLDTLIRHPEDLERRSWTIIGSIPRLNATAPLELPENICEQFRILRTNLQFLGAEKKIQKIVISSPSPSEGKSTVATNLALVLARNGKKTVLIDCDLRKPVIHKHFNLRRKPGITDVVLLGTPLEQALHHSSPDAPAVICAGTTPPSPVDFFTSSAFISFLNRLAETYEYIIIDTPPVLVSADALALAAKSDGILLVTRMNQTDIRALTEARKLINQAQARILGVVANGINLKHRYGYYRYKYRYYHYRYATNPQKAEG
ncbi:MAG: polysaccharide biosynthesis tyrosine autokinase [candidate division WOR-3 bacterium]|jgi:tyrosine-protein kinase Etk/Wzc|nr:polysaccharide biosynthesis tyrosine autokinase [candidate division WOR-3 bacterium]MCR4423986.1 polysaccharide biosynthesis tyrosine autokinase [candidate division WOR-3 bacterium]MDH7519595.1 polysaccharide biosynthesis tyrosine autokinase [bacterium]